MKMMSVVRAFFLGIALLLAAAPAPVRAQDATVAQKVVEALQQQCWSCEIYKRVASKLNDVFSQMFQHFAGGATGFLGLASAVLTLVLAWRVLKVFGAVITAQDHSLREEWDGIFRFAARSAVVFVLFLGSGAVSMSQQASSGGGQLNPVRDFFVDGPLAAGTAIGCMFMEKAQSVGTAIGSVQCSSGGSNYLEQHIGGATAILKGIHGMGVGGVALGVNTMVNGGSVSAGDAGNRILIALVGFCLALMFLMFTVTFGLRYLDALLKAMVALALAPVFLVLWVFDATRHIAHAGLRAVLFMGALFASSGVVYVMAMAVMGFGYKTALSTGENPSAGEIAGKAVIQVVDSTAEVNFFAIAVLVGCWGIAIGLVGAAFRVAEELVSFAGAQHQGEMGAGREAASKVGEAMQGGVGMVTGR